MAFIHLRLRPRVGARVSIEAPQPLSGAVSRPPTAPAPPSEPPAPPDEESILQEMKSAFLSTFNQTSGSG